MRLHSLTIQAVGPFAGRHEIDFAQLAAGGLFLLEGPTGAGKSTIIDAIVFALYGKVAGAGASEDRLRSAFAPEDVETVVDLVFETGAGVYRVRRTPAYDRVKRRGSGSTRQQATVKLWRLGAVPDGPADEAVGDIVSTRLDEAGAELTRVVGLDRTQFVQTMVLPQGEFASFLRADPEQRRGLLQRIFGTEVYERVQQRLEDQRREVQRGLTDARNRVQDAVSRFVGAARLEDETAGALLSAAAEQPAAVPDLVAVQVADLAGAVDVARVAAEAAAGRSGAAREQASAAAEVLRRARSRRTLLDEHEALSARAAEHAADVERLARGRRAAVVRPVLRGLDEARGGLTGAEKELVAAVDAAPRALVPRGAEGVLPQADLAASARTDLAASARTDLAASRDLAAGTVATLTRLVRLEAGLGRAQVEVDRLGGVAAAHVEALAGLDEQIAARPAGRAEVVVALDAATATAATEDARRHEVDAARAVLRAVQDLATTDQAHEVAVTRRERAVADAREAVRVEAALRTARLAGFAGEIAAGLADGEECPVCGSTEHPHVAPLAPDHVGQEQVEDAERARQAAEALVTTAGSEVAALAERRSALARATEGRSQDEAQALTADREQALATARAAATERDGLRATLDAHDARTATMQQERTAREQQRQEAESARERAAHDLARDRAEVETAREGHPTVAARHSAAQSQVEAADGLLAALDRRTAAAADVAAREVEVVAVLAAQDFADEEAARDAVVEAQGLADVERAVERHRTALARVELGLAEEPGPEIEGPLDAEAVAALAQVAEDLAVAEQEARVVAEREGTRHAAARDRVDAARAAATLVDTACAALAEQEESAAPVVRMAGLAAGTDAANTLARSLPTYVLVRRFEDVVAAANERLRQMSDGRYELERSDEREDVRTRKTGLAMRVLDRTTEKARDPRTLSGGETFYVSLCLALGMADVVTGEAGGIELGTLFVDEGFGTLDPETLDVVLAELGRLRAGGRVVGVVSHVEAMKQAVAERIAVRRRADGSSTLTVVAG
jgi:exonuclease SbcC